MLPHDIEVVSQKPTILYPAGQSEVQMHPDVVVQGAVIGRGVGTEWVFLPLKIREPLFSTFRVEAGLMISYSPMFPVPSIV